MLIIGIMMILVFMVLAIVKIKFQRSLISFCSLQSVCDPSTLCSIDESQAGFKGHCKSRVRTKGKPNETGIKFYILTTVSAFPLCIIFYESESYRAKYAQHTDIIPPGCSLLEEILLITLLSLITIL